MRTDCDVLIIGAGMAGACAARQLRLRLPELKIIVIDQKKTFDYWVGESTVEVWEDYMTRVLDLGPYLSRHHLQKHGLRFFFDNPERTLSVAEMSEYGRVRYHSIPARQIDRARFDTDLCEMNRELGIDVRLGVKVPNPTQEIRPITLDRENGHCVQTSEGPIRCRWLIDASGRNSPLARQLALVKPETRLLKGSYWSRYRGFRHIDTLGTEEWRRRVNFTQRYNSTNHFMYRGYWIWHIAIDEDILSIGVEFDEKTANLKFRNGEEFDAWLRQHACMEEILGDKAEQLDFLGLKRLSYCAEQFFSADRWFLTGMSGVFASVLGSSTSRFYATSNMLLEDLIRTDLGGERALLDRKVGHFNLTLRSGYESTIRFLNNMERNGSFDVWGPFFSASLALYFNSLLPAATGGFALEIENAATHEAGCGCGWQTNPTVQLRLKIAELADEFTRFLDQRGEYYAHNAGRFESSGEWEERPDIERKIYKPRDLAEERRIAKEVYQFVCRRYVERMAEITRVPFDERVFLAGFNPDWSAGQTLADLLRGLSERGGDSFTAPIRAGQAAGGGVTPEDWFHRRATHYVEAQVLFHLNRVGILSELAQGGAYSAKELASRHALDMQVTETLLDYVFAIDELLERDAEGRYALSPFGKRVVERFATGDGADSRINMFDVRVGGFGPVWNNLGNMLTRAARYGEAFQRDGAFAEHGVRKLAMRFWPTLNQLLIGLGVTQAMEIGLTTGLLERVGVEHPRLSLYGLDKSEAALRWASENAVQLRVNTIRWLHSDLFQMDGWRHAVARQGPGLIYSLHFHEFLAHGEARLVEWLRALKEHFPHWYVVAFEQPRLPHTDRAVLPEAQWLYAQSNVLIHHLIGNGRILDKAGWIGLGQQAGCVLVDERSCDYLGYRAFVFQL